MTQCVGYQQRGTRPKHTLVDAKKATERVKNGKRKGRSRLSIDIIGAFEEKGVEMVGYELMEAVWEEVLVTANIVGI